MSNHISPLILSPTQVQRSPLFCAKRDKRYLGRARQNSLATAGTNFTKPGAHNKGDLCTIRLLLPHGQPTLSWPMDQMPDPASCVRGMYKWRRRPRRGRAGDGIHQSQMTELISCASMTITRDERGVSKSQNVTCKLPKRISISERRGQHWVWRITGT